jgi:uncharacterized protein YdgA (DUF945 family)
MRIRARYVVALVIIVGAVAAAPFIDGYFFKMNFFKLMEARSRMTGAQFKVTEYSLGYLSSTATVEIALDPDPTHKVVITSDIKHGPYLKDPNADGHRYAQALITSQVHLDKSIEQILGVGANQGLLQVLTWVSFTQGYESHGQTANFNIKVPGQTETKITWPGLVGTVAMNFKHDYQVEDFQTALAISPLVIVSGDHALAMSGQQLNAEGKCGGAPVCTGSSSLLIGGITASNPSQTVKITGINYAVESKLINNNNFDGSLALDIAKYENGQDLTGGPLSFRMHVTGLNASILQKLTDDVNAAGTSKSTGSSPSAAQLMLLAQLATDGPKLIMPGFATTQQLSLRTNYGNFNANGLVSWPAPASPADANDFMNKVQFTLHLRASTSLVDQTLISMDQPTDEQAQAAAAAPTAQTPATNAKPQSFEEMLDPLKEQGLTLDEERNIIALQQKNIAVDAFNSFIDSRVAIRKIPAELAPILKKDYVTVLNSPFLNVAANAGAFKQLDMWVRENKITSDTRASLILLQKQRLSSEIYNASIDDIVASKRLPGDLGEQLKNHYATTDPESSLGGGDDSSTSASPAVATTTDQGENRKKFDAAVQQGFIKQDKDQYITDIVYKDGVLKVNGVTVPLPISSH